MGDGRGTIPYTPWISYSYIRTSVSFGRVYYPRSQPLTFEIKTSDSRCHADVLYFASTGWVSYPNYRRLYAKPSNLIVDIMPNLGNSRTNLLSIALIFRRNPIDPIDPEVSILGKAALTSHYLPHDYQRYPSSTLTETRMLRAEGLEIRGYSPLALVGLFEFVIAFPSGPGTQ
jgi:hypothetical protein